MTDTLAQKRSAWRWLRRVLIALGVLLTIALAGAAWVVRHMDTGWVKDRLRGITGLELDYTDAQLKILTGIHLSGATIASPEKWRGAAPFLIRAGGLDLGWSLFSKNATLQKVVANDVDITIVVDEHGHSSLEGLRKNAAAEPPTATGPLTPGRTLAHLMDALPDFGTIALSRTSLTVLRTRDGNLVERTRVDGLTLHMAAPGAGREQHVTVELGSKLLPERPILTWTRAGGEAGEATGKLWLSVLLDADRAEVRGEIAYDHQTLSKEWPKKATLLAVDAKARAEHDRLAVELDRFELIDQALTAKGAIDVDPGRAHVLTAQGKIDLARLVRLQPKGLVPIGLREGHARYDVALLEISAAPSLDPKGRLEIDGALAGVRVSGSTAVSLDQAKLEVRGKPAAQGGLHLAADLPAGTLHVEAGGTRGNLGGVHLTANASFQPGVPGRLDARVRFNDLSGDGPPGQLAATVGDVTLELAELIVDPRRPRAFDGAIRLGAALASFDARRPDLRTHASDLRLEAHTRVAQGAPGPVELTLPLGAVEVVSRGETVLPAGPAKLGVRVDRVRLEPVLARSSVDGRADVTVGPITLGAAFQKHAEAVDFDLTLDARRTSLLTAFAPASLALPGARMAMKLGAKGRVDGHKLRAQATLHLDRAGVTVADSVLAAAVLDATASLDGSIDKQTLSFTLEPQSLVLDGDPLGSGHLTAAASWDLQRPSLELHLDGRGDALPSGKLTLTASVDKRTRALTYAIDGDLGHLAALEPLLPASLTGDHIFDLSDLRARVQSHGTLSGLVRAVKRGLPELEPHPLTTLSGDDELAVQLEHVHYVDVRGVELTLPGVELSGKVRAQGGRRTADLIAHVGKASLVVGAHRLDLAELHDETKLTAAGGLSWEWGSGEIDASHTLTLGKLTQDWQPAYPIARVSWTGRARRGSDGTLHVDEVIFDNPGGGTRLVASGSLILPRTTSMLQASTKTVPLVGFRSMTLSATLDQKLDPIAGDPKRFKGSGSISIVTDLASGDLHRFHLATSTRLHKASIDLPEKHVTLVGLDGSLPLTEDLRVDGQKVTFAEVQDSNVYPTLRFSDQHPFLSGAGGLTAEKITVGNLTLTRVAGNLRVQRNRFAVDQLEAETRGGRISGQCLLDYKGLRSTLQLRLRLSGIEALHGGARERFDGNAALAFSAADRTIEGRAEILRIGRHHLYDLLDGYDPAHTDRATNRVRRALELGYPDHVRVLFERGFASYSIAFGGLARLIRVDDVHGIPTGPLIDKYLGPLFALEGAP